MSFLRLLCLLALLTSSGCLMMEAHPGVVVGNPEVDEEPSQIGDEESPQVSQLPSPETPNTDGAYGEPPTPETPPTDDLEDRIQPIVKEPIQPETSDRSQEMPDGDRVEQTPEPAASPRSAHAGIQEDEISFFK